MEGYLFTKRRSTDVSKALFVKLWWKFRTQKTMWTKFMWVKYCKRHRTQVVEWRGGYQTWKYILLARDYFDQEIWWEPKCGHASIWYYNWIQKGALQYYFPIDYNTTGGLEDVHQLMDSNGCNVDLLKKNFPVELCDNVVIKIWISGGSNN